MCLYTTPVDPANRQLYQALGSLIRKKRRALDLTQDELAGRLGISRGTLANIETGRQNFLFHQLYRFAAELKMDVHELLPVPPAPSQAADADALPLPKGLTSLQKAQVTELMTGQASRKRLPAEND